MSKIENIKQIVCNTIAAEENGASWGAIMAAINAKYQIKNWLKEVRNPMQALISMNVIERTDDVFNEVYVFTAFTKELIAEMS